MSGAHAVLSPSSAHRWMACPGSVEMEKGLPDTAGDDAAMGTAAHALAQRALVYGKPVQFFLGEEIAVDDGDRRIVVDQDMVDRIAGYKVAILNIINNLDGTALIEEKVPIDHLTGEPHATGTSDAIVLGSKVLAVVDLKDGYQPVEVADNPQLKMYALGALEKYSALDDFEIVHTFIYQPRVSDTAQQATYTVDELEVFRHEVLIAAGEVARHEGKTPAVLALDGALVPGEKQCQWCKAKAKCPALAKFVQETVGADFADITGEIVGAPNPTGLARMMQAVPLIEDWAHAVRAEVERLLLAGDEVPGFKLVQGRSGARKWSNEPAVEELMKKKFRLKADMMYEHKLITPTTAEKVLKTNPKRWEQVQAFITQAEGRPSVAPAHDKRPALQVAGLNDFLEKDDGA